MPALRSWFVLVLVGAWLAAPFAAAQAAADRRVALVIGNGDYQAAAKLANPVNDARAMAAKLKALGFDVIEVENGTQQIMRRAVGAFSNKLGADAVSLFFYAGHGMQVNGHNYLIPVDAQISTEQTVRLEAVDVDAVIEQMSMAKSRVNVVILDACRNNPYERRFRSVSGGLASIEAPTGTLIAYATSPGKVAADGDTGNGLYTSELVKAIDAPGAKIEDVFKRVRAAVVTRSSGDQTPWESSSLTGDFYFTGPTTVIVAPAGGTPADRELAFWYSVKDTRNPTLIQTYLDQFPHGTFAGLAKAMIEDLKKPQLAAVPARPDVAPAPAETAPAIEEVEGAYITVKRANLRDRPAADAKLVKALEPGVPLTATGKVKDSQWFRVASADGKLRGFVFGDAIQDVKAAEDADWQHVKDAVQSAPVVAFLRRFPAGAHADQAKTLRDALMKSEQTASLAAAAPPQVAAAAPPALPTPPTPFATAKAAYERKDYGEAMRWFRSAADAGEGAGMAGVGTLYALALGVPANDNEAKAWFKKAAAAGDGWVPDINKLMAAADPHSAYLTEAAYREMTVAVRGEFAGIGIELTMADGHLKVVAPIDDAPAAAAGLKAGDVILRIEGASADGLTLTQAVERLRGPVGSTVRITIGRSGRADFDVTLTRAQIRIQPVKTHLEDGHVGYLRITSFTEQTQKQTLAGLDGLARQAGGRLDGLVLDLRNDPGGLLSEAVAVAGDFLDGGIVTRIVPRGGRPAANDNTFTAPPNGDRLRGVPIVVLINDGTASASEIVTGALQDHRRARVLGTRSFGKGTVQTLFTLDGYGALRITTAEYQLPSGRSIQARGITPDEVVQAGEAAQATAAPVNEARLLGSASTDKIEPSIDAALIGTDRDPQLRAAVQRLGQR